MYVRWKRQRLSGRELATRAAGEEGEAREAGRAGEVSLSAVLVRSKRVSGKPHPEQQLVAHLATIQEGAIAHPVMRAQFWEQVRERVAAQPLTAAERAA